MYLKYFKYSSSKEASKAVEEDELHEAGFRGDQQRDHRWRVAGDKADLTIYQNKTKLKKNTKIQQQEKQISLSSNRPNSVITDHRVADLAIYHFDLSDDGRSNVPFFTF